MADPAHRLHGGLRVRDRDVRPAALAHARAGSASEAELDTSAARERRVQRRADLAVRVSVLALLGLIAASVWTDRALAQLVSCPSIHRHKNCLG